MVTRRHFSLELGMAVAVGAMVRGARAAQTQTGSWPEELGRRFAEIEARCGGRLGVGILDTQSGHTAGHREDERFPMCSTHKALSAAAVLAQVDREEERLDRRICFGIENVLPYSPGTKAHADGEGMTLAAICEAAVTLSDNTAANLMLDAIGGPAGLTAYLRGLGDEVTRLDRTEPTLNEALPGDPRDTTSPLAMAADLNRLVLGKALSPTSRDQLTAWLVACKTSDARLRAGIPQGWRVGDKTGTGDRGTANDVGVLWPPERNPAVVAAFITGSTATQGAQDTAIADVARAVVLALKA
jgi:beta-lactamase class A